MSLYKVIKNSLCTWWLQYRNLQVMFKVSPASLQTFIDTRLTLTPSVIPNSNYVIMVSDWNSLNCFLLSFCTVIIMCTEIFYHSVYLYNYVCVMQWSVCMEVGINEPILQAHSVIHKHVFGAPYLLIPRQSEGDRCNFVASISVVSLPGTQLRAYHRCRSCGRLSSYTWLRRRGKTRVLKKTHYS
jgi:hypothetical protein